MFDKIGCALTVIFLFFGAIYLIILLIPAIVIMAIVTFVMAMLSD